MFRPSRENFERMRQNREGNAQRTDGPLWAARQIEDDGRSPGSAESAAEDGQRRFAAALGAHQLGNAFEHPFADGYGGFRRHVARTDSGAAGGDDQPGRAGGSADRVLNGDLFVWN